MPVVVVINCHYSPKIHSIFSNILFFYDQSGPLFAAVAPQVTPICSPSLLQVLYCVVLISSWQTSICIHVYPSFIKFIKKRCCPIFWISSRARRNAYSQTFYQIECNKNNITGNRNNSVLMCIIVLFYVSVVLFYVLFVSIVLFYVLFVSTVLFYVLFVCKYVLYYCHRVVTQLQLNILYNFSYVFRYTTCLVWTAALILMVVMSW